MVVACIGAITLTASLISWFPKGMVIGLALIALGVALDLRVGP